MCLTLILATSYSLSIQILCHLYYWIYFKVEDQGTMGLLTNPILKFLTIELDYLNFLFSDQEEL